jgi:hypothetical protein
LAFNMNEYQKIFLGIKHTQHIRLTTQLPSVSRLSTRQCGIHDIPQPHRPPRPVTGIAFFYWGMDLCVTSMPSKITLFLQIRFFSKYYYRKLWNSKILEV